MQPINRSKIYLLSKMCRAILDHHYGISMAIIVAMISL